MGKLKELWGQLRECSDEERPGIQKEINKLEQFCIGKGYAGITKQTDWSKSKSLSSAKALNPPVMARYRGDRCIACVYNHAAYCDPTDKWSHQMHV